jgi:hypothetical protein
VATLADRTPQEDPAPPPASAKPAPPQHTAADRGPKSPPVKGDIAATPSPPQTKKGSPKQEEAKTKENNLEKIRREVASKLKFQNSLDLAATRGSQPGGEPKKGPEKKQTGASGASTSQVVVAKFRDADRAQARVTQMRKQGEKVVLKEGKDDEGQYFAIYRQITASSSKSRHVSQSRLKKNKPEGKISKSAAQ